ncbi:MAG: M20/M25/M40 family metallo-hydrolase, partial [Thermoplasmata archaeon]
VKTMRDLDGLPINILLLLEGEEEKGSPNLREVVKGREEFQEVELAYISDGPIDESNRPQVLLGVRGLLYVELQANGADKDLHSGIYGGPLPNPAWELIRILDSMKDENGKINIDGFYEDVLDITDEDKEVLKEIPVDEERIKKELGIDSFAEGPGDSYHEKLIYHPTLNIPGFTSGYTGEGVKTIIPCEAKAKIDMRLVADQDPDDIFKKFSEHVKERGSESVDVEIVFHDSMKPYRIPLDSPLVKPMMKAVRGAWKQEPVLKPAAGGSLPSYVFAEELGIDCVVVPYANADENNHSPDENLALDCFEKGIKTTCRVAKYMSETY